MVRTNDTRTPVTRLKMAGHVDRVVTITPTIAKLYGSSQNEVKTTIRIVPEQKYAFKIIETRTKVGDKFDYSLDEINRSGKSEYTLTVINQLKSKGRYFDTIFLKTDSVHMPEIKIRVFGKIS